jgi:alpha-tubulin suppressor-like RCC1 family protein
MPSPPNPPVPAPLDLNSTVWAAVSGTGGTNGGSFYTEVGTGLNFLDQNGALQRSQDLIELTTDGGAAALHGQHKVYFPPALTGLVTVVTVSNRVFNTRPLGLVFYDESSGRSAPLVTLQESSVGELLPPNSVAYPSAFSNAVVNADIRFSYTHNGLECDVVFLNQLGVTPGSYGMNSATTRLQFWHSWEAPSQPETVQRVLSVETNAALRATMLQPDLLDSTLDFGDLWFPLGRTALIESQDGSNPNLPVEIRVANPQADPNQTFCGKQWLVAANGTFMVESVNWADLAPKLGALPAMVSVTPPGNLRQMVVQGRSAPVPVAGRRPSGPIRLAASSAHPQEYVWAYVVVPGSGSSYTFGSGTYFLSGSATFNGTVTFSAGAVLKFAPNLYLLLYGPVVCNGTTGSPTVMTSMSDDLFGEMIFGSTHTPTNNASQAIWEYYETSDVTFSNLRIRYAQIGVQFDATSGTGLTHQFNNSTIELSGTGLAADNCTVSISSSGYCEVSTTTENYGGATFSGSLTNECSGNVGGIPDTWPMQYFGTTNGYSPISDPDGDATNATGGWNTLLYDYQKGLNPAQTMVAVWGADMKSATNVPFGLGDAKVVTGGLDFCVALETNGVVRAWGSNGSGGTNFPAGSYNSVGLTNAVAIAANYEQAGAVLANGNVLTWGADASTPPTLTSAVALALGVNQGVALLSNGTVTNWGSTTDPECTNNPYGSLNTFSAIACGAEHNVGLLNNGTVVAWGRNNPYLNEGETNVPPALTNAATANVVAIAAGFYHTLALLNNGTVVAWGAGQAGDTGAGNANQSVVPAGLSNVVAIAAGAYTSMALRSDGTVFVWGTGSAPPSPLGGVIGIGCSSSNMMAIRSIPLTPFVVQPIMAAAPATSSSVNLETIGEGLAGVQYQWQSGGVNISGATNGSYAITNLASGGQGVYEVIVSNGAGSVTNSATVEANAPVFTTSTPQYQLWVTNGGSLTFGASVGDNLPTAWPLGGFQWQFAGTNLPNGTTNYATNYALVGTSTNYTLSNAQLTNEGNYTLAATNLVGTNSVTFAVRVIAPGSAVAWGYSPLGQLNRPSTVTNLVGLSSGYYATLGVTDSGSIVAWGSNTAGQTNIPSGLPPALSVSVGLYHCVALLNNGTVTAWGANGAGQTNVPAGLSGVAAVAAGGYISVALLTNGTVTVWGDDSYGETNTAPSLTNVSAIAAGNLHVMALMTNGTVTNWGYNYYGQTNVPPGLSNVTAIAAGYNFSMALLSNGTVVAWGQNNDGQTNVPASVTNAMAIAAGEYYGLALLNNGTVVGWGQNTYGQLTAISNLPPVKTIAAGYYAAAAVTFSPWTQYRINVAQDLLLIYNTNSASTMSSWVESYYLANRPMVSGANVLAINSETNETITPDYCATNVLAQISAWLGANPTKRPQYVILFPDVPSRVNTWTYPGNYGGETAEWPSVQVDIATACASNWAPFVSAINFNTTNDCAAYINKLVLFGSNYGPGELVISASGGGYENTNYVVDNIRDASYGTNNDYFLAGATNGLALAGVSSAAVRYVLGLEPPDTIANHLTSGTNIAGYFSWGGHSVLETNCVGSYATNGAYAWWSGQSSWWLIGTVESFNGTRFTPCQGDVNSWFASNAFGGSNYSNTPVGAVSYVDEPGVDGMDSPGAYFSLWASKYNFGQAAWISRQSVAPYYPPELQVVGDPFVKR